ncbi:hypothetical protein [Klebsiella phage vB_KpnS-VAC51]|uniref:Uncharacterized protein n=1 Tax=Klebsiella phage vB_KpnS-VAC51 TaxID=2866698 RepID=A0AAE9C6Q2_9CAUD|nr:hypothetical protein [Klebsiella phage vB_KpnS-VAC51]
MECAPLWRLCGVYISHPDYNWKIRLTEGPHSLNRGRPLPTGGIFKGFHESS